MEINPEKWRSAKVGGKGKVGSNHYGRIVKMCVGYLMM